MALTTAVQPTTTTRNRVPVTATAAARTRARRAQRAWDVNVVVAVNAILVVGLWVRHGGLDSLGAPGATFTAIGQLTGLLGTYAVLIELLLMSRIGWLERWIGFDRLTVWHRWGGFSAVTLLVAHAVFITLGYADSAGASVPGQIADFIRHYPDVLMSIVGLALFLAVAVTSVRAARRRVSRETWYSVHLYAYLAVALSFAHQLSVGTDFSNDALARAWWVALYVAVFAAILAWRVGRPLAFNARHRLRIQRVQREADGVVSVYVSGRKLDRIRADAGQFFLWRFLQGTGWTKAHPFSLSGAPNARFLRITVKDLGDDTRRMQRLRPGVRVFAEGPYGTFTATRRTTSKVVLIGGGIGITPLRALLQTLPDKPGDVMLLYRAATEGDIAFRSELEVFARRGVDVRLLVGTEIGDDETDQLGVPALRRLVPDITTRDVYLCGPPPMLNAVLRRLVALRVPPSRIHYERFEY
ncbi:MAG: oxidoreductase [Actinomycetia bacterium]|nr:oxidoreductase [Actinomycetes bacterium]